MKASVLAYGGILLILIISSLIVAYIIGGVEPVSRTIVTQEGGLMTFGNEVDLFDEMFNQSIEFISQRAAYDLGKTGGVEGSEPQIWDASSPTINALNQQLENRIKENLPTGTTEGDITISYGDASTSVSRDKYYMHVEIGYTLTSCTGSCLCAEPCPGQCSSGGGSNYCIPNPEYIIPNDFSNFDNVESSIQAGVEDNALRQAADILESKGVNRADVFFLVQPYFAENHKATIKYLSDQGFTISVHMHEDWLTRTSTMSTAQLTAYIKQQKTILEDSIGKPVTLFSYGPGQQLDDICALYHPGVPSCTDTCVYYGCLTDDEKRSMFQAIHDAGFTEVQTAREYSSFLPSGLTQVDLGTGLQHSFDLYTSSGTNSDGMNKLENTVEESSKFFQVEGYEYLNFHSKAVEAQVSQSPHYFYSQVSSNYFSLLNAGRAIMGETAFNTLLKNGDLTTLKSAFKSDPRFTGLDLEFDAQPNYVDITVLDKTCLLNSEYYCIAPLKSGETGIIDSMSTSGNRIPYDWLKLKFRVAVQNMVPPTAQQVTYTFKVAHGIGSVCVSSADKAMQCTDNTNPNGITLTFESGELIKLNAAPSDKFIQFVGKWQGTAVVLSSKSNPLNLPDPSSPPAFQALYDGAVIEAYFCQPASQCLDLGKECGSWQDECGTTFDCGPDTASCTAQFGTCTVTGTKTCSGGSYGSCSATDPRCIGKQCGSDECGGSCGPDTASCTAQFGTCTVTGTKTCSGGSYGSCSATDPRVANCNGKPACSSDGCGGTCDCTSGTCVNGVCQTTTSCPNSCSNRVAKIGTLSGSSCSYQTKNCMYGCDGTDCAVGKWCTSVTCGDTCCVIGTCDTRGTSCSTTAKCISPTDAAPTCTWTDKYDSNLISGCSSGYKLDWCSSLCPYLCCTNTNKVCTASCSLDDQRCKYS